MVSARVDNPIQKLTMHFLCPVARRWALLASMVLLYCAEPELSRAEPPAPPALTPTAATAGTMPDESGAENALAESEPTSSISAISALDPAPYVHLLAAHERQRAGDLDGARAELGKADALDPGLLESRFAAAWLDFQSSRTTGIGQFIEALNEARGRFGWQATTAAGAGWGFIAILLVTLTVLAAVHAAQAAGPLHHLLTENLGSATDHRVAALAAALLLLLPLFWGAGALASALTLLILAGPRRQGAARVIAIGCALIVFLGLAPRFGPALLRPTDFRDKAQILDLAGHAPLTPALADRLTKIAADGVDLALLVHGNALYRSGQWAAAEPLFARYAEARPKDARGPLALGNCRLAAGDAAGAAAQYKRAANNDPSIAEPLVNLALAYSTLMRFEMATTALAEAARIDRSAVSSVGISIPGAVAGAGQAAPLELGAKPIELWALLRAERTGHGVQVPSYIRAWLPWQGRDPWPVALLVLAAAALARQPITRSINTFLCSGCGSHICRRCVNRRPGLALCRRCARRVKDLPGPAAIRLLRSTEGRQREPAFTRHRPLFWNLVLPGYGLIQAGRHTSAVLLVGLLAAAWIGFQTAGHPVIPLAPCPVGVGGRWAELGFALAGLSILALTAGLGMNARPALGMKRHGRISPLTAGQQGLRGRAGAFDSRLRTGTDG